MKKSEVIAILFQALQKNRGDQLWLPQREKGLAFAPTNIALCKYWGKRDDELNLPMTSSLSVALPDKGAMTNLTPHAGSADVIKLNGQLVSDKHEFALRICEFLNLFRPRQQWFLQIDIAMNIPVAAGLASSACGFASLVSALNDLFNWQLSKRDLSILARLGSGSAARSLWMGFVEWHAGIQADGMDCYAEPLPFEWPALHIGLLALDTKEKPISSREAMLRTVNTSLLYENWPKKVVRDMIMLRQALQGKKFSLLGGTAESNALNMHATMLSSWPPICYFLPETMQAMQQIWALRRQGLEIYFTQDAGPNLKILFLEKDKTTITNYFPKVEVVRLFEG